MTAEPFCYGVAILAALVMLSLIRGTEEYFDNPPGWRNRKGRK